MRKSREYNKYNIEHSIKVQGADIFNAMQFFNNFTAENCAVYVTFKTLYIYRIKIYRDMFYCLYVCRANLYFTSFSPNCPALRNKHASTTSQTVIRR